MDKVKVFEGHNVPKGAFYFNNSNQCFYNKSRSQYICAGDIGDWEDIGNSRCAREAVELPDQEESPKPNTNDKAYDELSDHKSPIAETVTEWIPKVGDSAAINFDSAYGLCKHEKKLHGEAGVIIGSCLNSRDKQLLTIEIEDGECRTFTANCFIPAQSKEDKERDEFIKIATELGDKPYSGGISIGEHYGNMFDAGFTAPKGDK